MSIKRVYLAGPIAGLSYDEATHGWRSVVDESLSGFHGEHTVEIHCYSPMRGKVFLKEHSGPLGKEGYAHHPISTPLGIIGRDRNDVMSADLIFMNVQGATLVSIGTTVELGWADAFRKPIVLVTDKENPHSHMFYNNMATYVCYDLEEGIQCALSLLVPGVA